jgi:hypothetical protein
MKILTRVPYNVGTTTAAATTTTTTAAAAAADTYRATSLSAKLQ